MENHLGHCLIHQLKSGKTEKATVRDIQTALYQDKSGVFDKDKTQAALDAYTAMYEYGNNTAQLADKYLQLAKQATSAKQFKNAKSWEQAASELATSSAKQAQQYT